MRSYEIVLEGLQNNKEFCEVLFSTQNRDEALEQFKIEKAKIESDDSFFLKEFIEESREWELDSSKDISMPIIRYEAHNNLNYAELYVSIAFGDDCRDLSLDKYRNKILKVEDIPLNFNYE